MLESYIFRQIYAKLLPKTKAALFWRLSFRMGSFAKAYPGVKLGRSCDPKFFTKAELELRHLFEPAKAKVVETT